MKITVLKNHPAYGVTRDGRVWSRWKRNGNKGRIIGGQWNSLKPGSRGKYSQVMIYDSGEVPKQVSVHTLILEAFSGPCPYGYESRHLNGKTWDNRSRNLKWGTAQENSDDRRHHGTVIFGTKVNTAKLDEKRVLEIRKLRRSGVIYKELSKRFGVTIAAISYVVHRKSWKRVK